MLLGALQDFEWYNEPANFIFRDKALIVQASPQTDFFQSRHRHYGKDNGHFFFTRVKGDFTLSTQWQYETSAPYDQCGIMLRIDANNWLKASIMYDNPERPMLGSSVTQQGY